MNNLKFRVWDSREQSYINSSNFCISGEGKGLLFFQGKWQEFTSKDFIFQQFTGLKDINGKEIYEGDIVSTKFSHDLFPDIYKKPRIVDRFGLNIRQSERMSPDCYFKLEILGNIFENPDLLDKY